MTGGAGLTGEYSSFRHKQKYFYVVKEINETFWKTFFLLTTIEEFGSSLECSNYFFPPKTSQQGERGGKLIYISTFTSKSTPSESENTEKFFSNFSTSSSVITLLICSNAIVCVVFDCDNISELIYWRRRNEQVMEKDVEGSSICYSILRIPGPGKMNASMMMNYIKSNAFGGRSLALSKSGDFPNRKNAFYRYLKTKHASLRTMLPFGKSASRSIRRLAFLLQICTVFLHCMQQRQNRISRF